MSLVCICCAAISALNVTDFALRAGYFYGIDNFSRTQKDKSTLYDPRISSDFLREIGFSYYAIKRNLVTYRNCAVFEDETLKVHFDEKRRQIADDLFKSYMEHPQAKAEEYNEHLAAMTEEEPVTVPERTTEPDGTDPTVYHMAERVTYLGYDPEYDLQYFKNDEAYIVNPDGTVSVNEAYILAMAQEDAEARSVWDIERYKSEYAHLKSYLSQLKSLEYFVVNNATGEAFTNSGFKTAADFTKAYSDSTWFVSSGDNFSTAVAGGEFERLSRSTSSVDSSLYGHFSDSSDIIQTKDGIIISSSAYTYHFFHLIRYGYNRYMEMPSYSYIIGSTDLFEPDPFTVYLSFDYSRADQTDPYIGVYTSYTESVGKLERSIVVCLVSLAADLILLAVFFFISGKGRRGEPVALRKQDRIPAELHFAVSAAIFAGAFILAVFVALQITSYEDWSFIIYAGCVLLCILGYSALLNGIASFNRRRLNKTLLSNLLVLIPFKLVRRIYRRMLRNSTHLKDGVRRHFWFLVPPYLILSALCWFLLVTDSLLIIVGILGLLLVNAAMFILIYSYVKSLDKIRDTVSKAQEGDFDVEFDCASMPAPMTKLAHEIEDMREGMKQAIETAIQDQRTKTELITNVSHDLKTPLTSIIAYTDLIRRCDIEDETVRGYADVLAEKSQRLKRLIEDLTEATKASTGAVELQIMDVDLYELAMQAVGENEDELEKRRIDVRFTPVNGKPIVRADGQKTYRVFENIISNIAKYALEDTVSYVMVGVQDGFGTAIFKNISAERIEIPPDQLMERFVRGDTSRSGEGSGLGLSIARDLCALQGGSFDIYIDGDMFTARVALPLTCELEKYKDETAKE